MDNSPSKRQRFENGLSRVSNEITPTTYKIETVDLTAHEPATPTTLPEVHSYLSTNDPSPIHTFDFSQYQLSPGRKRKASDDGLWTFTETRLRQHLASPPQSFYTIYGRARKQRFYVLQRTPGRSKEYPEETFEMTGSTGNIYTVRIKQVPSCDCPHAIQGNQCKHIVYILSRILQAPFDKVYQLALLNSELRDIFAKAPAAKSAMDAERRSRRKDTHGDCPICFCAFDNKSPVSILWCYSCGQNIHQECFDTWAKTKAGDVTCPSCRGPWEDHPWEGDPEMVAKVQKDKGVMREGYVNVAAQLGIKPYRDHSIYSIFNTYTSPRRRQPWCGGFEDECEDVGEDWEGLEEEW